MYEELIRKERKRVDSFTKEAVRETQRVLELSIEELEEEVGLLKAGTLNERFKRDYLKALNEKLTEIKEAYEDILTEGVKKGAAQGTKLQEDFMKNVFDRSFSSMFSRVQDNVTKSIIDGELYKDKRTLSDRVWNLTEEIGRDIQSVISKGLLLKKSARELAIDLRQFVKPPDKQSVYWREEQERRKYVNYRAKRLARTAINHAYQTASIQAARENPFCDEMKWLSSRDHRVCPLCQSREGKIFKLDDIPLDHPNGRCALVPVIGDTKEIDERLKAWIRGEEDEVLDIWAKGLKEEDNEGYNGDKILRDIQNIKVDKLKEYKNVDSKLEGELQKRSDKAWENDLLFSEQNALQEYSYTSFGITNRYLRNALYSDDDIVLNGTAERIKELDRLLSRNKLGDDLVLHRGVSYKEFEEWKKSGIINTYKSTSIDPTVTYTFDSVYKIKINAPSETQGFYLGKYSEIPSEKEFLLHRGQKYRILKIEDTVMEVEFYA